MVETCQGSNFPLNHLPRATNFRNPTAVASLAGLADAVLVAIPLAVLPVVATPGTDSVATVYQVAAAKPVEHSNWE